MEQGGLLSLEKQNYVFIFIIPIRQRRLPITYQKYSSRSIRPKLNGCCGKQQIKRNWKVKKAGAFHIERLRLQLLNE